MSAPQPLTEKQEAVQTLRLIRETCLAALYLPRHVEVEEARMAWRIIQASDLANYLSWLDHYLTGNPLQDVTHHGKKALMLVLGMGWMLTLSDQRTCLHLRIPTPEDTESVRATFEAYDDVDRMAEIRWRDIDILEAQPREFGPPDQDMNEILAS